MTRRVEGGARRFGLIGLVAAVTAGNVGLWAVTAAGPRLVAATPASAAQLKLQPFLPFTDGKPFRIVVRRSDGMPFAATLTATIKLRTGPSTVTDFTGVTATRHPTDTTAALLEGTAKRPAGSTPPLTGTLTFGVTSGGVGISSDPVNAGEWPNFEPCPPVVQAK